MSPKIRTLMLLSCLMIGLIGSTHHTFLLNDTNHGFVSTNTSSHYLPGWITHHPLQLGSLIHQGPSTPPLPGTGTFDEDFTTTTYQDVTATNVSGWGSGTLQIPRKTPTLAGSYDTLDLACGVFVAGDYAYVADNSSGLQVINVSIPSQPSLAGSYDTPSWANDVFVSGDFAYVADGYSGLQVINVSIPSQPSLAGSYDTPYAAIDVFVWGDFAYVADGSSGLQVINVSIPSQPSLAGSYDTPSWANDVFVSGDFAYVADGYSGLQVINVSIPSQPSLAGSYDTPGAAAGVFVWGDFAYVADYDSGLQVINVSIPSQPSLAGSYDTPDYAWRVFVSGDYAYVADNSSGLQVINITIPSQPSLAGSCDTPGTAWDVFVCGNFAYVADGYSGLQVINNTDPTSPTLAGSYDTPGYACGVFVWGDFAYVADGSSGLQVVDISDPTSPSSAGGYDTPDYAYGVFVWGDFAYVGDGSSGLQVINITDPTSPTLAGSYDTPGAAVEVFVWGDFAYVADYDSGLQVINVSIPSQPSLAGSYDTPDYAWGVFVSGDFAYVADGLSGLQVINITDPTSPTLAGGYDSPGNAQGVFVWGDFAYVADGLSGLQVVDISDPTSPTLAGGYDSPGNAYDVFVWGDFAYVADLPSGLQVINITDPTSPTLAGGYDSPGYARGVFVWGDFAYVADYDLGLQVVAVQRNRCRQYLGLAVAQSTPIYTSGSATVVRATLTATDTTPTDTTLTYFLSADNGSNWEQVTSGVEHPFINIGKQLKWKAVLSTTNSTVTPQISSLSITYQTKLDAPTLYSPSDGADTNDNTPDFSWSSVTGAASYLLQLDTVSSFDSGNLRNCIAGSSPYTPASVLADGTWYWRVAANDSQGDLGFFSGIRSLDIDATDPTWDQTPANQVIEYCTGLRYDVNASDPSVIDKYWINDTAIFSIDPDGVITNASTPFAVGIYWLEISVNDTFGNYLTATIKITVEDTTDPVWDQTPTDQVVEFCSGLRYDVNATDHSGVTYWINDTVTFTIDGSGVITNVTALPVGEYWIEIRAYDPYNNYCTATIKITVADTINPSWNPVPSDQVVEYCSGVSYDVDASDHSGVTYWINDTVTFTIDGAGVITNITALPVGVYWLEVRAYDPYGNFCQTTFSVIVQDTTPPSWDQLPTNQVIELGQPFSYDVEASDLAGIDHYWINDTSHFAIDATGTITNITTLAVSTYGLQVRAYDPSNNYCSATFTVTVEEPVTTTQPPPIPGFPVFAMMLGLLGALGTAIYYRRRRR